jgi:hypothetical protein
LIILLPNLVAHADYVGGMMAITMPGRHSTLEAALAAVRTLRTSLLIGLFGGAGLRFVSVSLFGFLPEIILYVVCCKPLARYAGQKTLRALNRETAATTVALELQCATFTIMCLAVTLLVVTGSTNIRSLPTAHKLIGDAVVRVRWHDVLSLSWKKLKAVLSFDLTTVSPVTIKVLQAIANVLARW